MRIIALLVFGIISTLSYSQVFEKGQIIKAEEAAQKAVPGWRMGKSKTPIPTVV